MLRQHLDVVLYGEEYDLILFLITENFDKSLKTMCADGMACDFYQMRLKTLE